MAMRNRTTLNLVLLAAVVLLVSVLPPLMAEDGPVAVFPETEHDVGTVKQGANIEYTFTVQNKGTTDLEILRVAPG